MLLRNYDNIMLCNTMPCFGNPNPGHSTFGSGSFVLKDKQGSLKPVYRREGTYPPFNNLNESSPYSTSTSQTNLVCGSGLTPEHYDDYKLEAPFTTTEISNVSGVHKLETPIYDETTDSWIFTYTRNYLAKQDITIREIGALYGSYVYNSPTSASLVISDFLVYRKVLETPLEVKAGNQFTLTFTATLSANPNKPADYDANAVAVE